MISNLFLCYLKHSLFCPLSLHEMNIGHRIMKVPSWNIKYHRYVCFRNKDLSFEEVVINGVSPSVLKAKLSRNNSITIKFDRNVEGPEACQDIFSASTYQLLGKKATLINYIHIRN